MSGTPGGNDGNTSDPYELHSQPSQVPMVLDMLENAVIDMAGNKNIRKFSLDIVEIADTVPPQILNASLN